LNSLRKFDEPVQEEILESVEELKDKQFSHPQLKPIKDRKSEWIWRLKVKEVHTDHRLFIDFEEKEFLILDLDHRDTAYKK
jgi:mRNA-degrading endonuclease RelE of RelBE toxin-antitoxin system